LSELLLGAAEHYGAKSPAAESWLVAYEELSATSPTSVYATGPSLSPPQGKRADPSTLLSKVLGYHLLGVEGDDGRFQAFIDQSVRLLNDPKVRKLAEQEVDRKFKHLPLIKKVPANGLPAGSTVYEFKLTPKDLKKLDPNSEVTETLVLRLSSTKVGDRSWFVLTPDDGAKSLVATVVGNDASKALSSREGLDALRTVPAVSAGFVTLAEYARSLEAVDDIEGDESKIKARDVLLAMPAHGETPIQFRTSAAASGPTLIVSVIAPKAALEDATAAAVSVAARSGAF
jgi:hypothetical protein